MRRRAVALVALAGLVLRLETLSAQTPPGHRLPEGTERPVREREVDITHVAADLAFDMGREEIAGRLAVTFAPIVASLADLTLDTAAGLDVSAATVDGSPATFEAKEGRLRIRLPAPLAVGREAVARIEYRARPRTGLYFFPAAHGRAAQAWNYGEGGLHYGWLPLYNDVNERFTADFRVRAPRPLVVISNGRLEGTQENPDGTRTFHWVQEQPIPNYLLTVDVGDLARVPLASAALSGREVPLAVWTPPGTEEAAAYSFKDTPRMVEFFSQRFGYPFPWTKYDQVVLREFAIGAMETTTATGFSESHLHRPGDPPDSGPAFHQAHPTWTYEDTIAHELAHHWFGDLVTCRSLGSIFLNESFASFSHLLWNGEAHGEDELTYQRWRYLQTYLDYVRRTGVVRPLEFFRYTAPEAMYQEETTYVKGALVLHMLRHILGDDAFFRGVAAYLKRHEFGSVESIDLQQALEEASGRNLTSFFEDWIRGGGGHPAFQVSWRWVAERKQVDLAVRQTQADLPFENAFRLPVDVEIVTAEGARVHHVEVAGWTTNVSLPADTRPLAVVFDKGGWLVADVSVDRPLPEALYLAEHGALAERLRAAHELGTVLARHPQSATALARLLSDTGGHWGLRQQAAASLGAIGSDAAVRALVAATRDGDDRIRRAAVVALGAAGGQAAAEALGTAIEKDASEGVVAAAELALGRTGASSAKAVLLRQLSRSSRWWDAVRLGALQGLAELRDPALVDTFAGYVDDGYEREVRTTALEGWFRAAPQDERLAARLRQLVHDRNLRVRSAAIEKLAALHHAPDVALLRDLAASEPDPNFATAAREAADEIDGFVKR